MRAWFLAFVASLILLASGCKDKIADGKVDGASIYHNACSRCHGRAGVPPPAMAEQLGVKDLSQPSFHVGVTDKQIRDQIWNGAPSKGMPAFQGALSEDQVAALVRFVRSLRRAD